MIVNEFRMTVPSKERWLLILAFVISIALTLYASFIPPLADSPLLDIIGYELAIAAGLILIFAIIWLKGLPAEE